MHLVKVRYGDLRFVNEFKTALIDLRRGELVVAKTERGTELGMVITAPVYTEDSEIPSQKTEAKPDEAQEESTDNVSREVLRRLNEPDYKELDTIHRNKIPKEMETCKTKIKELNLPMTLVSVEHIIGGEKIIFYFLAEGRVDFRELVKQLASEYKTRIEMRQIGVRDEARLVGDFEHCGQELCCKAFLKDLEPVTMKMAKQQKTMMDPSKISGRCGRLMCCLRFEDETYTELRSKLPRKGSRVYTAKGTGDVVDLDVISQQMTVELESGDKVKVSHSELIEVIRGPILKVDEDKEDKQETKKT